MATRRRRMVAAAAGVAVTAGIAAGAVTATGGPRDAADDLAEAINERAGTSITADDVEGALRDLMGERLDEAVAEGRITREGADRMLQRAEYGPGLPGLGGPAMRGPIGRGGPHGDVLEDAARALGLTEAQVRERLDDGGTLARIAAAEGVARAKVVAAVRAALVGEGVPAERAADIAAHIVDRSAPPMRRHRVP